MRKTINAILVLLFAGLITGCKTTRNIERLHESESYITKASSDSIARLKVDSTVKVYDERLKSLSTTVEFLNQICNDSMIQSVITDLQNQYYDVSVERNDLIKRLKEAISKPIENKVIYKSDGSIEFKGQISKLNLSASESQKIISELNKTIELEIDKRIAVEEELKKEKAIEKKVIKRTTFNLWWLLVVGYLIGMKFPPKKIFDGVKKLFIKK